MEFMYIGISRRLDGTLGQPLGPQHRLGCPTALWLDVVQREPRAETSDSE